MIAPVTTRLAQLVGDVDPSGWADGDVLTYSSGSGKWQATAPAAGVTDHGALTGLSDDDHAIYALLAGRNGGQTLIGDTASGGHLTLQSTAHATKGRINTADIVRATPAAYGGEAFQVGDFFGGGAGTRLFENSLVLYDSGYGAQLQISAHVGNVASNYITAMAAGHKFNKTLKVFGIGHSADNDQKYGFLAGPEASISTYYRPFGYARQSTGTYPFYVDDKGAVTAVGFRATPVTLTDAATIATDASLGDSFRVTIAADRTLGAPTNPTDGQSATWEVTASGADRTLTLATGSAGAFAFNTDITGLTATVSGTTDIIVCRYRSGADRWMVVGYIKGA